jgi:hypothetical protein
MTPAQAAAANNTDPKGKARPETADTVAFSRVANLWSVQCGSAWGKKPRHQSHGGCTPWLTSPSVLKVPFRLFSDVAVVRGLLEAHAVDRHRFSPRMASSSLLTREG